MCSQFLSAYSNAKDTAIPAPIPAITTKATGAAANPSAPAAITIDALTATVVAVAIAVLTKSMHKCIH